MDCCALCRRERQILSTAPPRLQVCAACSLRIGAFLLTASRDTLERIWDCRASPSGEVADDVVRHARDVDDALTHANLAVAYCDLGLAYDALHEAGVALRSAGDNAAVATLALSALDARLRPTGDAELRRVLYEEN